MNEQEMSIAQGGFDDGYSGRTWSPPSAESDKPASYEAYETGDTERKAEWADGRRQRWMFDLDDGRPGTEEALRAIEDRRSSHLAAIATAEGR